MAIDIGPAAIDRSTFFDSGYTIVAKENPANDTGTITRVEIFAVSGKDLADCEVATFYVVSGDNLSTRDSETIGSVTSGSKQTFSGLDMDVQSGDYIGIYYSAGQLERDASGDGTWYQGGDRIPCTNFGFITWDNIAVSLYGTGGAGVTEKQSSDSGAGADSKASGNPVAVVNGGETGSGADSLPARDIALSDSGSGVDAVESLQTPAAKTSADTGSGVDAVESLEIQQDKTSADTGSGAEGTPLSSAVLAGSESGSGLEALVARLLAGDESGSAVEASSLDTEGQFEDLFADEPGEGADRLVARIEMPTKGGGMKLWT